MTRQENLRRAIKYALTRKGEATPRELAAALDTDATTINQVLATMRQAHEVDRIQIRFGSGKGDQFKYFRMNRPPPAPPPAPPLPPEPPTPLDMSRFLYSEDNQPLAKLPEWLFNKVQEQGRRGYGSMRIGMPMNDAVTAEVRQFAVRRGYDLKTSSQFITVEIVSFMDAKHPTAWGLKLIQNKDIQHYLKWFPDTVLE